MNEDEKRRVDTIMEMCKMAWSRISERRRYEWRVTFGIWSAIGSLIVILMTQDISAVESNKTLVFWFLMGIGVVVLFWYTYWLSRIKKATSLDRQIAIRHSKQLREQSNSEFDCEFQKKLTKHVDGMESWVRTWIPFQLFTTVVLIAVVLLLVCGYSTG